MQGLFFSGELTISLRLVSRVSHFTDVLPRTAIEIRQHMPAQNQRRLRFRLDRLNSSHIANSRRSVGQPWRTRRAPGCISFDQMHEL